jgi:vacuolar-type H+-ATPase subunit E/Vma4
MVKSENINQFDQQEIDVVASSFFKAFHFEKNQDRSLIERRKNVLETFIRSINDLLSNRLIDNEKEKKSLLKLLDKLIAQKEAFELLLMSESDLKNLKTTARNFANKTREAIG